MENERDFESDKDKAIEGIAAIRRGRIARIRDLAGMDFDKLTTNESYLKACLAGTNSNLRRAAIEVIEYYERLPEIIDIVSKLASHEPEQEVRQTAISALGRLRMDEFPSVALLLASIVSDESEELPIRRNAYCSLLFGSDERNGLEKPIAHIAFPEDVDWNFVDRMKKVGEHTQ